MVERRSDAAQRRMSLIPTDLGQQLFDMAPEKALKRSRRKQVSSIENPDLNSFAINQPFIFPEEYSLRYVRYTGEILFLSYPRKRKKQLPKQKPLPDISKSTSVPFRRWVKHRDIESVIRKTDHILEEQPKIKQTLLDVSQLTNDLFTNFATGQIRRDNFESYYETIYSMLKNIGLLRVVIPEKRIAVNQILKALGLDSLERFNSPASRLRLASSIIKQTTELIGVGKVVNKYDRLSLLLILEREFERYCLNEVVELSKQFLSLDPLQTNILDAANYLSLVTKIMFDHRNVKTAPYRISAFRFLFSVYGIPKEKNKVNTFILKNMFSGDTELIEDVEKIEAEKKSSTLNHSLASQLRFRERLVNGIETLEKVLDEGEANLPESYLNR